MLDTRLEVAKDELSNQEQNRGTNMTRYFPITSGGCRTPLVRLTKIVDHAKAVVLAKIEGRNPAFS